MEKSTAQGDHVFDLTGGHPALDFANTVGGQRERSPKEHLHGFSDLVEWARQCRLVSGAQAATLLEEAERDPRAAAAFFASALDLRELLYRIFWAVASDEPVAAADLEQLNGSVAQALTHLRVGSTPDGFIWEWDEPGSREWLLWQVVRAASELLTSPQTRTVRWCASDDCTWLFLDHSRNASRRWCDMKSCGNRDKARRHLARKKARSHQATE